MWMSGSDPPAEATRPTQEVCCAPPHFTLCSLHLAMDEVIDDTIVVPARSSTESDRILIRGLI
ncbi:MAG TPA: hypothetical protein VGS03_06370, partial [Candidatus Polarisedimenticolia bacterium]|nr:hypothetical protein [Candidatus Polarisedimenticolia bacterium]